MKKKIGNAIVAGSRAMNEMFFAQVKQVHGLKFGPIIVQGDIGKWEVLYEVNDKLVSYATDSLKEVGRLVERLAAGRVDRREVLWHVMRKLHSDEEAARSWMANKMGIAVRGKHKRVGRRSCELCGWRVINSVIFCTDRIVWQCKECQGQAKFAGSAQEYINIRTVKE